MKQKENAIVRRLRKKGFSLNYIHRTTKISKSTISLWVKDIQLTSLQKKRLKFNQNKKEIIEKRRHTRLSNESNRRGLIIEKAKEDFQILTKQELKIIGSMLYWAEGGKTQRSLVRFSNGDPLMIQMMMKFFRQICKVKEKKFRGYIHIHPHLDSQKAETYWSKISRIPLRQFYKTYNKLNKSSKNIRDSLPFGTFDIYICDTALFLKIQGWREKIQELSLNK
jgi:hypothetical protein